MADFEFGKLDFSTSFKPTSAFPLNANCLFSSIEAAQQAATTAEEPGSKNTLYHYGMQLLVVTDTTANWYKITRQKTLEELGSGEKDSIAKLLTSISYEELKTLRDNSELIGGMYYRITDYITTTTQENTISAGHQFDVIVRALTKNTLDEEAKAIQHEDDTYFLNSALSGWNLRYSLDNDTFRFAWADEVNGKGVIYRLIDENGNDCPYDFKNIQMQDALNTEDTAYYYTFDTNGADLSLDGSQCYNNVIKEYIEGTQQINKIIFISRAYKNINNNFFDTLCYNNTLDGDCRNLRFERECYGNKFGFGCTTSNFETKFKNNTVGSEVQSINVGKGASNNIFKNNIYYCTFGAYFRNNIVCNFLYYSDFGHYVQNMIMGKDENNLMSYAQYIIVQNHNTYFNLYKDGVAEQTYISNITIGQGTSGTSTNRLMIPISVSGQGYSIKVAKNSNEELLTYCEEDLNEGGTSFTTDETLTLKDGILSVNTAKEPEPDNTLPITSAAVANTVGNIEILLKTI